MEKFKKFDDQQTGKNPFMPAWANYKSGVPLRALRLIVGFPCAVIRVLIISLVYLLLIVANLIYSIIPIAPLRRVIQRLFDRILMTIWLSMAGFGARVQEQHASYRRLKLKNGPEPKNSPGGGIEHGCAVFTTYQSFYDVVYFTWRMSPTFAFPNQDGSFSTYSTLGALQRATNFSILKSGGKSLVEVCSEAQSKSAGPVVVFAEGERTNGACILRWHKTIMDLKLSELPAKCCLAGLMYSRTGHYTLQHTVNSPFVHFWWCCTIAFPRLNVNWLSTSDTFDNVKIKEGGEQMEFLRTLLVRLVSSEDTKIPSPVAVEVGGCEGQSEKFWEFWQKTQKKTYKKED